MFYHFNSSDTLDYHGNSRWLTPKSVNLLATNDVSGGADQLPTTKNTNAADDPCGTTRGCFRSPEDCYPPSSCTFFVAWNRNSDTDSLIDFELSVEAGSGETFGAVGFSENNKMPGSDVYACFSDGMLKRYFTDGYDQNQVTTRANKGLSNIMVDAVDGTIRCIFSRNIDLDDGDAEFLSLNKSLYVIGSKSTRNGDTLVYHGSNRWVTTSAVDLLAVGAVSGDDQLPKTKKAHGILMVIAWMFFASTGILVARYMKTFLPEETLCGTKVWFNIHRICMISTWVLFVSAFVAIFAVKGEFVQSTNKTTFAHAIMGCFAVGFGTINPIMAIFRPHPGTPRRPYFNHLHRIVGLSGWVCAITAIVLACDFYFESAESITDVGAFWIMFTFLIIAFTIILTFEIFNFRAKCDTNQKANQPDGVAMQPVDGNKVTVAAPTTSGNSCERWRTLIFGCSFLCIFILTVVMISEIAKV
ncbi:putative ferric-chelate reductase 1 homolog [Anneissia japonica]|uniref:putative ferric-chelate reductase 1 homolog n=1 Tax=Anneissia japonica TaxID=1529436 RepID=UPI00142555CD|nr:putative ferric-chelate reductase 1 homolog [Anneissia japonica]